MPQLRRCRQCAIKGLLYADTLAPHDAQTRALAAATYLRDGNLVEARIAIGPIASIAQPPIGIARFWPRSTRRNSKPALAALNA